MQSGFGRILGGPEGLDELPGGTMVWISGHSSLTISHRPDVRAVRAYRRIGRVRLRASRVVKPDHYIASAMKARQPRESADLERYARVFSEALGRPIRYRDVPLPAWSESLRQARFPEHLVRHLSALAELTRRGRYDRMTDTMRELTGEAPTNMRDFVKRHTAEFTQNGQHASSLL